MLSVMPRDAKGRRGNATIRKGLMKRFITLLVGLALMVAPSAAFAQSSSSQCQTYSSETCSRSR